MSVFLVTGQPGAGKTLHVVSKLVEEILPDAEKNGRMVFCNIDGLSIEHPALHQLPDEAVYDWPDCPEHAVFIIDECQRFFPVRNVAKAVPRYIAGFETHRHKGLDFYLITQHGSLLDHHLRPMVAEHTNVRRPSRMSYSKVDTWQAFNPNPEPRLRSSDAQSTRLRFNKRYFDFYKSATQHTVKPNLPWKKIAALAALLIVSPGLLYYAYTKFTDRPSATMAALSGEAMDIPQMAQAQASCARIVASVGDSIVLAVSGGRTRITRVDFAQRITEGVIQICG